MLPTPYRLWFRTAWRHRCEPWSLDERIRCAAIVVPSLRDSPGLGGSDDGVIWYVSSRRRTWFDRPTDSPDAWVASSIRWLHLRALVAVQNAIVGGGQ